MASTEATPSNSIRRRPRPILSCLECRRKKLGCDRQAPCNQCIKTDRAHECAYDAPPENSGGQVHQDSQGGREHGEGNKRRRLSSSPTSAERTSIRPATTGLGVVEDLQQRLAKLEQIVGQQQGDPPAQAPNESRRASAQQPTYYGSRYAPHTKGHRIHLFEPFTEAKTFLWSIPEDPQLKPYVHRLKRWVKQHDSTKREQSTTKHPPQSSKVPGDRILSLLPPKLECDEFVRAYFANSEKTLRILHQPSFMNAYDSFWKDSASEDALSFGFMAQLAAVLAAASNTNRLYGGRLSAASVHSLPSRTALCEAIQSWLDGLKRADRMKFGVLQTQTILVLCQHNVFLPNDQTWQATGSLMRRAMLLNLHRDPGDSKEFTPLEIEMRRRLWASIVEMDLQTSLLWGMPTAICETNFTTVPPANVDDTDFAKDYSQAPFPKPLHTWTDTLLQTILAASLRTRLRVGSFLNDLRQEMDHENRQKLGQELETIISDISAVAKPEAYDHSDEDASDRPGRLLGRILLDISLRRMLLYLYRPFAMNVSNTEIFYRARRICRDSALAILSHQDAFQPKATEFEAADAVDCWTLFETACRHDVLLAALSVCWEIRMMSSSRSRDRRDRSFDDEGRGATSWTKAQLTRIAEEAVTSLMQKIDLPGGFLKDVVGLSVILECVKSGGTREAKEQRMRAAVIQAITKVTSKLESGSASEGQALQAQQDGATTTSGDFVSDNSDPATFGSFDLDFLPSESLQNWDVDTLFSVWHTTS